MKSFCRPTLSNLVIKQGEEGESSHMKEWYRFLSFVYMTKYMSLMIYANNFLALLSFVIILMSLKA